MGGDCSMKISIFRKESLFDFTPSEFEEFELYMEAFMKSNHALKSSRPNSLDKLLFFHDLWSFLELGEDYEARITTEDVMIKEIRLGFIKFISSIYSVSELEKLDLNLNQRFIFCYRFLMKVFNFSRQRVKEETSLHTIRENYYSALDGHEQKELLQQRIIMDYKSNWFRQSYMITKLFKEQLAKTIQVYDAIHDVCGLQANQTIDAADRSHLMEYMLQADDLLEISFWKRKFKQLGLHTLFINENEVLSPTIVVCAQQSEYIREFIPLQLGLICAISVISEKEARDFVYIPFSEEIGQELYCEKGNVTIENYVQIMQQFLGGNGLPNYRHLLNTAFTMLKLEVTSLGGEIVLICDETITDNIPNDPQWQAAVERFKQERNVRIILLYIGDKTKERSVWFADKIVYVEEFQPELLKM